jgi:ATP-dependent 26S proteasome regulatory subunit
MSFGKDEDEGYFIVRKTGKLKDLTEGKEIPESDLFHIDSEGNYFQAEYIEAEDDEDEKYEAKPGTFNLGWRGNALALNKMEMRKRKLLTSYDNTKQIMNEAELFFKKVEEGVYAQLEKDPKRAILLYSEPGFGKTSAISQVCENFINEDEKTIVVNWPTSEVRSSEAKSFMRRVDYENCSRLIFIIEDIGGGEKEHYGGERGVDSSLLDLLDGTDVTFPIPTFIIATTNHPGNLLDALADRPGRFDELIELEPPTLEERIELVEFMAKRDLSDEEKLALEKADGFSVAHLNEIVIRSLLKDKTYAEVVDEMNIYREKFRKQFEKKPKRGIGIAAR